MKKNHCGKDYKPKSSLPIHLIATDLDGTLLNPRGEISLRSLRAMRACEARGIRFVLASGRTFPGIRRLARQAGLNSPIISCNGARVDASPFGPTLMEDLLPAEVADEVFALLAATDLYVECYSGDDFYMLRPERSPFPGPAAPAVVRDEDGYEQRFFTTVEDMARVRHRAYKFAAFSRDPGVLAGLRERLERLPVTINSAFPFNIEVMDMGRGKGRALTFLADHYVLKKEELMAFGDGTNDLEMLLASGTPVAMANGEEALKKIAAIVAPGNAEDGEAQVIEKWVLM